MYPISFNATSTNLAADPWTAVDDPASNGALILFSFFF